jgi:hypothetical protein
MPPVRSAGWQPAVSPTGSRQSAISQPAWKIPSDRKARFDACAIVPSRRGQKGQMKGKTKPIRFGSRTPQNIGLPALRYLCFLLFNLRLSPFPAHSNLCGEMTGRHSPKMKFYQTNPFQKCRNARKQTEFSMNPLKSSCKTNPFLPRKSHSPTQFTRLTMLLEPPIAAVPLNFPRISGAFAPHYVALILWM